MAYRGFVFFLISFSASTFAINAIYNFEDKHQEQLFVEFANNLRCLKCQNQSLADSNSPFAMQLKEDIYNKVRAGMPPQIIKQQMIARYSEFILFEPVVNNKTYFLWFGPLLLLGIAGILFWRNIRWK